ncbi:hypothetical protein GMOD_00003659 [Pyrenophora seminiperda CCB06]|uniref:DUF7730 domain-containing protein n=1 Tax=Pyrenophora seminiperda CCB06 TaxID=1302712 RepID=A0A3M7MJE6_9PLEO|nr:hypothetical protein GMOD_00003659 [Pyrenophora seminiperda CCB06]
MGVSGVFGARDAYLPAPKQQYVPPELSCCAYCMVVVEKQGPESDIGPWTTPEGKRMESQLPRAVLGKRKRQDESSDEDDLEWPSTEDTVPKRSRTQDSVNDDRVEGQPPLAEPSTTRDPSSLLTPKPNTLTESQVPSPPLVIAAQDIPKKPFPFMRLPAELRIHIYHMALVREEPLRLHADRAPEKPDDDETPSLTPASCTTQSWPQRHVGSYRSHVSPQCARSKNSGHERIPISDPILPEILRLDKQIYKEARQVLYSDNVFTLNLASGIHTLSTLHQRSRSLIKHVVLTIPSHHDILDGFADLVRLGLRYCWGLKTFKIILQASLPDDGRVTGATSVYANAFHILRWLPRGCNVGLEGNVSDTVKKVVAEEGRLQAVLDEASYLKRQHQMPERH